MAAEVLEKLNKEALNASFKVQIDRIRLQLTLAAGFENISAVAVEKFNDIGQSVNDSFKDLTLFDSVKRWNTIAVQYKTFLNEFGNAIPDDFRKEVASFLKKFQGWIKFLEGVGQLDASLSPDLELMLDAYVKGLDALTEAVNLWEEIPETALEGLRFLIGIILQKNAILDSDNEQAVLEKKLIAYSAECVMLKAEQAKVVHEQKISFWDRLLGDIDSQTPEEQSCLNQKSINWLREEIKHAENMTAEEAKVANCEWEAFKKVMNEIGCYYPEE